MSSSMEKEPDTSKLQSRGRRTAEDIAKMREAIWFYFKNGFDVATCKDKTKFNYRTVSSYYQKWKEEILEAELSSFVEVEKQQKAQLMLTLDSWYLSKMTVFQEVVASVAKRVKEVNGDTTLLDAKELEWDRRSRMSSELFDMIHIKATVKATPLLASELIKEMAELGKKYAMELKSHQNK